MTSELFEKNLTSLYRINPELAGLMSSEQLMRADITLEQARNGRTIAKKGGILLHSAYDPEKEAASWVSAVLQGEPRSLCVLGCGLGYHLKNLANAGYRGTFIEPDPALFRLALEHQDLATVLSRFRPLVGIPLDRLRRSHRNLLRGEIVVHPASLRVNPSYFEPLAGYGTALGVAKKGGLKILLVNPIYGGSLPAARYSAIALEKLGHTVEVFASEAFAQGQELADRFTEPSHRKKFNSALVSMLGQGIELKAEEFQPDLILALAQAPLHHPTLGRLEQMGIPTAFWFVEDYRTLPYWQDVAAGYGYFFGIQQGEFLDEVKRSGVRNYGYLPTAAEPEIHAPITLTKAEREEYGSPLSFVGAGYHNRERFFRGLTDYSLKIWGSEWPLTLPLAPFVQRDAARVDSETCVKIFNASVINLNLHSSTYQEGIDPDGDFVNPRTFEIASCSAFQLVDRRALMPDLFAKDELETFGSMEELRSKIHRYLTDPEARQTVAKRGRARVLAEHTYEARMEELLALMICAFPIITQRLNARLTSRTTLRDQLESHPGIAPLLNSLSDREEITLESLSDAVEKKQGTLSRADRLILMLNSIRMTRENEP
jgi:spore maturation protein CgeB